MEPDRLAPLTPRSGGLRPWIVLLAALPVLTWVDAGEGAAGLLMGYLAAALLLLPAVVAEAASNLRGGEILWAATALPRRPSRSSLDGC
jgi:hypothetical protein